MIHNDFDKKCKTILDMASTGDSHDRFYALLSLEQLLSKERTALQIADQEKKFVSERLAKQEEKYFEEREKKSVAEQEKKHLAEQAAFDKTITFRELGILIGRFIDDRKHYREICPLILGNFEEDLIFSKLLQNFVRDYFKLPML